MHRFEPGCRSPEIYNRQESPRKNKPRVRTRRGHAPNNLVQATSLASGSAESPGVVVPASLSTVSMPRAVIRCTSAPDVTILLVGNGTASLEMLVQEFFRLLSRSIRPQAEAAQSRRKGKAPKGTRGNASVEASARAHSGASCRNSGAMASNLYSEEFPVRAEFSVYYAGPRGELTAYEERPNAWCRCHGGGLQLQGATSEGNYPVLVPDAGSKFADKDRVQPTDLESDRNGS
ncbi:hypothetical protein DFH09DRAFT_1069883 [Mycena vulgaris]|nr:hypothetical protein DFH09DRAFT_1069883 [Mycena vulgaris]